MLKKSRIFSDSKDEIACSKDYSNDVGDGSYDNENIKEIIGNEIVLMSPVHYLHSRIVSKLFSTIERKLLSSKCLVFTDTCAYDLSELKTELGGKGKFVSPDVSVVCNPKFKGSRIATYPILAIEVLSPSTCDRDLNLKRILYSQMGISDYLIISKDGLINHYTLVGDSYSNPRIIAKNDSFISSVNPSIEINYNEFFGDIFTNDLFKEDDGEEV